MPDTNFAIRVGWLAEGFRNAGEVFFLNHANLGSTNDGVTIPQSSLTEARLYIWIGTDRDNITALTATGGITLDIDNDFTEHSLPIEGVDGFYLRTSDVMTVADFVGIRLGATVDTQRVGMETGQIPRRWSWSKADQEWYEKGVEYNGVIKWPDERGFTIGQPAQFNRWGILNTPLDFIQSWQTERQTMRTTPTPKGIVEIYITKPFVAGAVDDGERLRRYRWDNFSIAELQAAPGDTRGETTLITRTDISSGRNETIGPFRAGAAL